MILRVVKIGTSLLRGSCGRETAEVIEGYAAALSASFERGDKVVLVTSGAVGLGCSCLGIESRPKAVVPLQAAAAVGQGDRGDQRGHRQSVGLYRVEGHTECVVQACSVQGTISKAQRGAHRHQHSHGRHHGDWCFRCLECHR